MAMAFVTPALAQEELETVTVTGYRASLATAIQIKRAETAAVDSIVAEDIGKFPDANLAEAMQRIPGVTLSRGDGGEGRNISVRGLGPGFTRVRLNGMEGAAQTGSSDTYGAGNSGRSFDFNVFPTEIFSSLTARKTPSPDIEEGSLGATVDLRAPKPFDYKDDFVLSATVRETYQQVGEAFNPRASVLVSKQFGSHFGILGSLSYQHRKTLEVGYAAVDILPSYANGGLCSPIGYTGTQNPADNTVKGTTATMCSTNNPRTSTIAAYNTLMSLTGKSGKPGGGVFLPRIPRYVNSQGTNDRMGASLALQWVPDESTDISVDILWSRYGQRRVDSYIAGLSFARTATNNGQPMVSVRDLVVDSKGSLVYGLFDGVDVRSENLDDRYSSTIKQVNTQFRHDFSDRLKVDGYLGYSENVFNSPSRFQTVMDAIDTDNFSIDFRGGGTGTTRATSAPTIKFGFDVSDPTQFNFSPTLADGTVNGFYNTQGRPSRNTSVNQKAELNVSYKVIDGLTLKVGGSYRINNFSNWAKNLIPTQQTLAGSPSLPTGVTLANITRHITGSDKYWDGAPADWVQIDQAKLVDALNLHLLYCGVECGAAKSQIRETIKSAYIMGNFDFNVWGYTVRGDAGMRYAYTDQKAVGYIAVAASAAYKAATGYTAIGQRNQVDRSYDDWLPSANAVLELNDDLLIRASAAEVMTRAELGYLTPSASVTVTTRNGTVNNPYLDPIRANTYDLGVEWYFRPGSLLSVAYFHKDLKSYIQKITSYVPYSELGLPASLLDGSASTTADLFNVSRYANTSGGPLDGAELNVQVPLTFLPGFWSNFGVQANYTFVTSKINYILASANGVPTQTTTNDLLMLSPHSASGVIYWEDDVYSARVTGTYRSDFIRAIPASQDSDLQGNHSTFYLDASASYNINDWAKLIVEATNLTDEKSVLYIDSTRKDTLFDLHDGRTFSIGLNIKL
jgi:TonB-dependent receptor